MKYFPLFVDLAGKRVVISGAGATAVPKIRLLMKTKARIEVFGTEPETDICNWHKQGKIVHFDRELQAGDLEDCVLLYGADNNSEKDQKTLAMGETKNVLVNIVDNLQLSQFITPAIVDRDPVTIAIGTEGTAPVLARKIKARIEDLLPVSLGKVATITASFRDIVASKLSGVQIRSFWASIFDEILRRREHEQSEEEILANLNNKIENFDPHTKAQSKYYFAETGANIPDLLTVKALKLIESADVIFYDSKTSKYILELARREAILIDLDDRMGFEGHSKQHIITRVCQETKPGETLLQLGSNSLQMWEDLGPELKKIEKLGIKFEFVPGVSPIKAQTSGDQSIDLISVFLDDRNGWKNGVSFRSLKSKKPGKIYSTRQAGDLNPVDPNLYVGGN